MDQDEKFEAAEFRVRLFLSVDLSGSTAFKNSAAEEDGNSGSPIWVTTFEQFYRDFPDKFKTEYSTEQKPECSDKCPDLWKAVGDELVFCGLVSNVASVICALTAFIKTIHSYREELVSNSVPIDLKGASWVACFPVPNRTVQLLVNEGEEKYLSASEALESAADKNTCAFDFLGKAIDTGFRIASLATKERFILSVQLARILASRKSGSGFDYPLRIAKPVQLKGVNKDEPYPVLYIDTMEHLAVKNTRKLERDLLNENYEPDKDKLNEYLSSYCELVGTDEIQLPGTSKDGKLIPPQSYQDQKQKISVHLSAERDRIYSLNEEVQNEGGNGYIPVGSNLKSLTE